MHDEIARGMQRAGYVRGTPVVVALSGGPDSTALTLALHELLASDATTFTAAHFNHRIRGADADADEQFVRDLCAKLGLPLAVGHAPAHHADAPTPTHLSEDAARVMRYRFLERTAVERGARCVVTAHTADDQAETVLMRILRGTGIRGLAGMRRCRPIAQGSDVSLMRPMLDVDAAKVRTYLATRGVTARTDSSNLDRRYARNRVRHDLLPALRAANPGITRTLTRIAADALEIQQLVETIAAPLMPPPGVGIASAQLTSMPQPVAAYILQQMHARAANDARAQLTRRHIVEALRHAVRRAPSELHLPGAVVARSRYGRTHLLPRADLPPESASQTSARPTHVLPIPGQLQLPDGSTLRAAIENVPTELAHQRPSADDETTAHLSGAIADAGRLLIRTRAAGDRYQPLGSQHRVKLQDLFVNAKVPREQRDSVPVVEAPQDGRIAWVIGFPPADWAKVQPGDQACVRLTWTPSESASD